MSALRSWTIAAAAAVCLTASGASARPQPRAHVSAVVSGLAGEWPIHAQGGGAAPTQSLRRRAGWSAADRMRRRCPDAFPLQSVVAWKPYGELIVFVSQTGAPILTFQEPEDGVRVSNGEPPYSLTQAR